MKKVLTIAGSDCSGGAGIQADLKTMMAHGVYGMSAITALTAQNTTGVYGVFETDPAFLGKQLDCIFTDIVPDAVKIGMVSNRELILVIAEKLKQYGAKHIVVDPVMVATSGSKLMADGSVDALRQCLFPLAEIITPNIPEAEVLSGMEIHTTQDMCVAAAVMGEQLPGWVALKGGHLHDSADDLLYRQGECHWFRAPRVDNENNHGSGCTLSSAIACNLAFGKSPQEAFGAAKTYITRAMQAQLNLGSGSGPLHHGFAIEEGQWL